MYFQSPLTHLLTRFISTGSCIECYKNFPYRPINESAKHDLLQQLLDAYPKRGSYVHPRVNHDDTVSVSIHIQFFLITHVDQRRQTITFKSFNHFVSYLVLFIFLFISHLPSVYSIINSNHIELCYFFFFFFFILYSFYMIFRIVVCRHMLLNEQCNENIEIINSDIQLRLGLQTLIWGSSFEKSGKFHVDDQCGRKLAQC